MKIIVCLDDHNGMMFNNRRQSQDRKVREDMMQLSLPIMMNSYSYKMFEKGYTKNIIVQEELPVLKEDCYLFIENQDVKTYEDQITEVIVYYWNRTYPSDLKWMIDLTSKQWQVVSVTEFQGSSHDNITKTVYIRNEGLTHEV
ncbi:hypothetical protein [Beduini massiliensis]|uniref:hypothetical protein n=1 Tax=Beduini massiliensis TaxID=1585974 RepID=UPI00059A8595|nr:hypothetical protein [Beduini massiliensis]